MSEPTPLYRHYFHAPITGQFDSPEQDFYAALRRLRSETPAEGDFFDLIWNQFVEQDYTVDNMEPVDMPLNPEPLT